MNKKNIGKVVIIDWSIFLKMATNASANCGMQPCWIAMTMIFGNLKIIGIEPDDLILIACDGMKNWRKEYLPKTKEDRKEAEKKFQTRFPGIYQKFDELLIRLERATDWHIIREDRLEADDIMAVACQYYGEFLNKPVVLLSMDSDLMQLWHYKNVKWFSPHRMMKRYKIRPDNFNAHKLISKMILTKGHNNLGIPENDEEYEIKRLCTDLINLPKWISNVCIRRFMELEPKEGNSELLSSPTLIKRYNSLYHSFDKRVTYEDCVKKELKKALKKKKKKKMNKNKEEL